MIFKFLSILVISGAVVVGLFRWPPPDLLRLWLPLLGNSDWPINNGVSESAQISPGRVTWLFFIGTHLGEDVSVQQYLHWYPDEETAVTNYNQNKYANCVDNPINHLIPLPNDAEINQTLLCDNQHPTQLQCEYRAQSGQWTIHADFSTRQQGTLSLSQIQSLAQQLGERLTNTFP
ncbi:MAG: hypothetical protein GY943_07700 [Chloroflexi bacterium]|nr:hypothetical protein [Chloroflexota bacterium]